MVVEVRGRGLGRLMGRCGGWLLWCWLGAIMTVLDTTIVVVALSELGRRFHASLWVIQWVLTAYLLALSSVNLAELAGLTGQRERHCQAFGHSLWWTFGLATAALQPMLLVPQRKYQPNRPEM